uniref:Uncharacterized protein n=1 Tax=Anopheles farauti TaxID=69004 RepID=A0A182QPC1_9DIPT
MLLVHPLIQATGSGWMGMGSLAGRSFKHLRYYLHTSLFCFVYHQLVVRSDLDSPDIRGVFVHSDLTEEGLAVGGITVRGDRGSDLSDGGVSQRGGVLGNRGNSLDGQRLTVDDGVESVDGIGVVLDDATGAIGLNQRVRSGHNISRAGLLLFLVVSGHPGGMEGGLENEVLKDEDPKRSGRLGTYGNVVAVAVLRVRVVVIGNLGDDRGGNLGKAGVGQGSGNLGHSRRMGKRGSELGNRSHSLDDTSTTVDDGIESVDRIGGVLDDALRAIRFDERVRSGHNISRARLLLAFVVSGQGILHERKDRF